MRNVFLVLGMRSNLIAVENEGYDVIFSRGRVLIQKYDNSEQIVIGIHDGGLYRLIVAVDCH